MLSLRTTYQVLKARSRATGFEQVVFLTKADQNMADIARNARACIEQGTSDDPFATKIGVELGLRPSSDFLYDIAADYIYYLKSEDPKGFKEFLKTRLGEKALQDYERTREININFNLKARHPVDYYGFLQQVSGWQKLNHVMSSIGIKSEIFADVPEDGRHPLFAALTSTNGMPLRTLVQQMPKTGIKFPDHIVG
jgi:hypothetical protein